LVATNQNQPSIGSDQSESKQTKGQQPNFHGHDRVASGEAAESAEAGVGTRRVCPQVADCSQAAQRSGNSVPRETSRLPPHATHLIASTGRTEL